MNLEQFLTTLDKKPETIEFEDTMAVIKDNYHFTPSAFSNGTLENSAEQNQGSCKLLAFAQLNQLDQATTLSCFGRYYRQDVLNHPNGNDHMNIRNFLASGWQGVAFEAAPLAPKQ